nr:MAG: ATP-dependent sacrificial sulfur transferase LarE [Pseudomonadota bacterium]
MLRVLDAALRVSEEKKERAREVVRARRSAVVAFSGGVDSTLVLQIAREELGERVVALTAVSPSLAPREREAAERLARQIGVEHLLVPTAELADPDYVRNGPDRCYHCKSELYAICRRVADERGLEAILDGFNADDLGDHRPGRRAGLERGVVSPLLEAGLTKAEIRAWSRQLGLPTWEKPQLACLASRIPYGTPVTVDRLEQVARAEEALQDLGFRVLRVRHHGEVARLELGEEELGRLFGDAELRARVEERVKAAGFRFVAVDLEPFRSGRMNG